MFDQGVNHHEPSQRMPYQHTIRRRRIQGVDMRDQFLFDESRKMLSPTGISDRITIIPIITGGRTRGSKIPQPIRVRNAHYDHVRTGGVPVDLAQLLYHTHHRGEMSVPVQQVNDRVTLTTGAVAVTRHMHPNLSFLSQRLRIEAVYLPNYDIVTVVS